MHAYERWMILQYFRALLKLRPFAKPRDPPTTWSDGSNTAAPASA